MRRSRELAIVVLIGCGRPGSRVVDGAIDGTVDATVDASDDKVGVFIAQGDVGRTTFSCDDGNSWIGNHSWDEGDPMMCNQIENVVCGTTTQCSFYVHDACQPLGCCNESPSQPHGIAYGHGVLASVWGHGAPGAIRSSSDGRTWTTTYADLPTSVVAFGDGTFVTAHTAGTFISTDGMTWAAGGPLELANNDGPRAIGYGTYRGSGRFVVLASAGGVGEHAVNVREIVVSSDAGASWWHPMSVPDDCAIGVGSGDILAGNGVFLIVDEHGTVCRSDDGAQTWASVATGVPAIAATVTSGSNGVWAGSEFRFWGRDAAGQRTMLASPDGLAWTSTPMPTATALRAVAVSDAGTFVSTVGAYATQRFLRSTDGLTWQDLAAGDFVPSHAIAHIGFVRVDPGTICPSSE